MPSLPPAASPAEQRHHGHSKSSFARLQGEQLSIVVGIRLLFGITQGKGSEGGGVLAKDLIFSGFFFGTLPSLTITSSCQDMMADVESNPLLRPFCPDFSDCRSMEVVHYAKFR